MKKLFFIFAMVAICCLAAMSALAVVGNRVEILSNEGVGGQVKVTIKGTEFNTIRLAAEPYEEIPYREVTGSIVDGNTVFTFTPDKKLPLFNFKKGDTWALVDPKAIYAVAKKNIGIAGVRVDDRKEGTKTYCYKFKADGDPDIKEYVIFE